MKGFKKALAMVLSLTMIMTSLTVTTFGATWTNVSTNITKTDHPMWSMKSGDDVYLKLTKNIYSNRTYWLKVPAGATCHLDLNGFQLQKNSNYANCIENNGTLIITNSGSSKGQIYNNVTGTYTPTPAITNNGTLIMTDVYAFQGGSSDPATEPGVIANKGTLEMHDCIIAGKIVNSGNGTITPLTDGYYYDDMSAYVETGYASKPDTSMYTCRYMVEEAVPPIAWVTVDGTETEYRDIQTAKEAAQTATGAVTIDVEKEEIGEEDILTWRDDFVVSVETKDNFIYSNSLAPALKKTMKLTEDGTSANRAVSSIEILDDCSINGYLTLISSAFNEAYYRTTNIELNGYTITVTGNPSCLIYLNNCQIVNIYDSSDAHTGAIKADGALKSYLFYHPGYSSRCNYNIYGGTFTGSANLGPSNYKTKACINIHEGGSTFSADPSNNIDPGYTVKQNEDGTYSVVELDAVAEVTVGEITTPYGTIEEAIEAANVAGQTSTVKVLGDCVWDDSISIIATKITFDLNGNTVSQTAGTTNSFATIGVGSEFEVVDTVGGGMMSPATAALTVGSFIVAGTLIDQSNLIGGAVYVTGGSVVGTYAAQVSHGGDEYLAGTINGAVKLAVALTTDASEADILVLNDCSATSSFDFYNSYTESINRTVNFELNGKSITFPNGTDEVFGMPKAGTLNITDKEGTALLTAPGRHLGYMPGSYGALINVYGGTYRGIDAIKGPYNTTIKLYGGTFSADPIGYVGDGDHMIKNNGDGTWSVIENPGSFELTIEGETSYYKTLQDAWTTANASASSDPITIKLLNDAVWPGQLETTAKHIVLDLNGKTLQDAEGKNRLLVVNRDTTFDIDDTSVGAKGQLIANGKATGKAGAIIVYGNINILGGTVMTSGTDAADWSGEDVISAFSFNPSIVIDGGTVKNSCPTKAAIGLRDGSITLISGSVAGGIRNVDDAQTINGTVEAKIIIDEQPIYFPTLNEARTRVIESGAVTSKIALAADVEISSPIDFMTAWNEGTSRVVNFDFNGHNVTATKKIRDVFGINSAGSLRIYDNAGGAVVDACGSPLFYSCGYANDFYIYGGEYINSSVIGSNRTTNWSIHIDGGTYPFDVTELVASADNFAYDNGDGSWTVKHKLYLVTIGGEDTYVPYIASAVDTILAAPSKAGTITPIEDVTLDDTIVLDDADVNITFDLDGKKVAPAQGKAFADVTAGSLTITNGEIDFTGCGEEAYILLAKDQTLEMSDTTFTGSEVFVKSSGTVLIDGIITTTGVVLQEETSVSFYEIAASIADDVKFNLVVNAALIEAEEGASVQLQYTVDTMFDNIAGRKTFVIDPDSFENGQYTFRFADGIPQWSVNSDLELKVLVNEEVRLEKAYTLQDYYNTLNAYFPEETLLNTLTANQLKFAEELQKKAFGSSEIEYAGWEEEFISVAEPTEEDNVKKHVNTTGYKKDVSQIASATVNVTDRIALTYSIYSETDYSTLTVSRENGEDVEVTDGTVRASKPGKPWYVYQSKISPVDYDETYTVTLKNAKGDIIHAITYSVNSYCYSMVNGSASQQAKDTALALYRYGVAAAAYTREIDPDPEHHFGEVTYEWAPHYTECTATRKCLDNDCGLIETETATAYKTVTKEAEGDLAEEYTMTARFVNPAFRTQVHVAYPDPKALTPVAQQNPQTTAYAKHLITNADGSIGGTLNKSLYGEGAPKDGALDQVDEDGNYTSVYYAVNDYYNLKSTATRVILPEFQSYQQTMQYSDGIACVLMALNYMGEDVEDKYTEENLVKLYEQVNSTTVKGNGTTQEGLAAMLTSEGFNAKANDYKDSGLSFDNWVKSSVQAGKIIMGYFHMDRQERWMAIIGYDDMGTSATGDDIYIFANPYDVWDHYQDGYYNGGAPWMYAVDLAGTKTRENESVAIIPENPKSLEYDYENDPVKCYPSMGERHLLYNIDGTWGGALNAAVYGGGGTQNGQVYYEGEGYRSREHFEYNYYAFPDIYNMTNNGNGLHVLPHWESFEQTMASSCGISSTLNTLHYLGYDLTQLSGVLEKIMKDHNIDGPEDLKVGSNFDILQNIVNGIDENDHSKMQEAIVAIYALNDDYFSSENGYLDVRGLSGFNNYGGVGAGNLHNVPLELGFNNTTFGRYYSSTYKSKGESCMPFPTYDSFLDFVIENIDNGQPIIFCGPNHWRVIIGIDTMGTTDTRDDIIFLGDSSDGWDHFQNGIDTEPARTWYAKWYNGGKNTNQQYILIKK